MMKNAHQISSKFVQVGDLNIHYLIAGEGAPLVLVHGWPTSSYLWRNVIPLLAKQRKVIALDLPGYGRSDKPLDVTYNHNYHAKILGDFIDSLGIKKTALAVHDVGGPIGLLWAIRNQERLERLMILDTIFYPDGCGRLFYSSNISFPKRYLTTLFYLISPSPFLLKLILLSVHTRGLRKFVFSPFGIARILKMGIHNKEKVPKELISAYQSPFNVEQGRQILAKAWLDLRNEELKEIIPKLSTLKVPVLILYGENDIVLPTLAAEMRRLKNDLPDAQIVSIPNCGHYLQEDQPEAVARHMVEFLSA